MAAEDTVRGRLLFRRSEATPTYWPRRASIGFDLASGSRGSRTAICVPPPSQTLGGVRGEVRPGPKNTAFSTVGERVISREHYLMWRQSATGAYVRLGRFFVGAHLIWPMLPLWVSRRSDERKSLRGKSLRL